MNLEETLKEKIRNYDRKKEELDKEWESLHDLKPKTMSWITFQELIQKARYETKQSNLDFEMINNFKINNPTKVKEWIYKGANKIKLYDYVEKIGGENLSMTQGWLLEDLHNIKEEKHFPYEHDKDISDPKTITTEEFNKLFEKWEKNEEFSSEELNNFLHKYDNGYTAIDNTYGNLFTEDFRDRNMALRYLAGESIDKLREEELKYEVAIYETKEDYEQGEPFQENIYSDLEEAKDVLVKTIKLNNFYSGFVLNQKTGEEEFSYYADEQQKDIEEDEEEIDI